MKTTCRLNEFFFLKIASFQSDLEECHVSPWLFCTYSVLLPLTILISLMVSGVSVSGIKIRITWTEKPVSVTPNANDIQLFSIGIVFSHHLNLKFLFPYLKIFYFHKGHKATLILLKIGKSWLQESVKKNANLQNYL